MTDTVPCAKLPAETAIEVPGFFMCTIDECPEPPLNVIESTERFMRIAGQLPAEPGTELPGMERRLSRLGMLVGPKGEVTEYVEAETADDPVEIIDGLWDSVIVELGTMFDYFGVDLTLEVGHIIAENNLAKLTTEHGVIKDETNKVQKPPGHPDAKVLIVEAMRRHGWSV